MCAKAAKAGVFLGLSWRYPFANRSGQLRRPHAIGVKTPWHVRHVLPERTMNLINLASGVKKGESLRDQYQ